MSPFEFPAIDPVLVQIGPVAIRWYALAYLAGFIFGWRLCLRLARLYAAGPSPQDFDDFLTWAVLGTVLGGRLGYVLFYQFNLYWHNPAEIFALWHGGMSFHGGALGVILAMALFAWRRKLAFLAFADVIVSVVPIGLGLGRLANFVNGELYGRPTAVPWGVVFPQGGAIPRHPSQLYEAALEGLVLFILLYTLARHPWVRARHGLLAGLFLLGYGAFRYALEVFREPDEQIGFLWDELTMGQALCLPMLAVGGWLAARALKRGGGATA